MTLRTITLGALGLMGMGLVGCSDQQAPPLAASDEAVIGTWIHNTTLRNEFGGVWPFVSHRIVLEADGSYAVGIYHLDPPDQVSLVDQVSGIWRAGAGILTLDPAFCCRDWCSQPAAGGLPCVGAADLPYTVSESELEFGLLQLDREN